MGAEHGQRAVMGQAVQAASGALSEQRAAAAGEQLALLPAPMGNPRSRHLRRDLDRHDKAGRPAGAQNKNSRELREYLLSRGVHPLQRMMEWMRHSPQSLAAELGCSQLEAFDRLKGLWEAAAPYFAPKLAPTDDAGNAVVPFFGVSIGGVAQGGDGRPPWDYLNVKAVEETQQNQALPSAGQTASHGAPSHEEAK